MSKAESEALEVDEWLLKGTTIVSSSGDSCNGEYGWITSSGRWVAGLMANGGGELTRTRSPDISEGLFGDELDEDLLEKDESKVDDRFGDDRSLEV